MSFIAIQPNGLYCRFSTVCDCPSDWNLTEEDYCRLVMENYGYTESKAKEYARDILDNHLHQFQDVIDSFIDNNMSMSDFKLFLDEVGFRRGQGD
jgi:hypothetical protein